MGREASLYTINLLLSAFLQSPSSSFSFCYSSKQHPRAIKAKSSIKIPAGRQINLQTVRKFESKHSKLNLCWRLAAPQILPDWIENDSTKAFRNNDVNARARKIIGKLASPHGCGKLEMTATEKGRWWKKHLVCETLTLLTLSSFLACNILQITTSRLLKKQTRLLEDFKYEYTGSKTTNRCFNIWYNSIEFWLVSNRCWLLSCRCQILIDPVYSEP